MNAIEKLLEESRRELLDLSTRNRLLSMPVESKHARIVHVLDEKSDEVFRLLVGGKKAMSFAAGAPPQGRRSTRAPSLAAPDSAEPDDDDDCGLPQPDDELDERSGQPRRHVDSKLQTALTPDGLQARLLSLYRDAQLFLEEQGVNILYLALGRLKWFEEKKTDTPRFAPLLLVPVRIERQSARERFTIAWNEDDVQENLTLAARMKQDYGLELPALDGEEDLVPSVYAQQVAKAVGARLAEGWAVEPDAIALGFFSFAKFLMYRDLDPKNWSDPARLLQNPSLCALLKDGFPVRDNPFPDNANLDAVIPAERLDHVVEADSSQTQTIELVRQGQSLVVQGPPGTGKSQTIANLLATAVLDGKRVLFIAEKRAALEVVKRRLETVGLGDVCLELHSQKANKRAVLEEIGRTWELGRPKDNGLESIVARLEESRARLNEHARILHAPLPGSGLTPFRVIGVLVRLGDRGREIGEADLPGAASWTPKEVDERRGAIAELQRRIEEMGVPAQQAWYGCELDSVLAIDLPQLGDRLATASRLLALLREAVALTAPLVRHSPPQTADQAALLSRIAVHAAAAPRMDRGALCSGVWQLGADGLRDLVAHGKALAEARTKLADRVAPGALETDFAAARASIAARGHSIFRIFSGEYRRAMATLRGVVKGELPGDLAGRLALLDELQEARGHLLAVRKGDSDGKQAFGAVWRGEESDWALLASIVDWVAKEGEARVGPEFRRQFAEMAAAADLQARAEELKRLHEDFSRAFTEVRDALALRSETAFGVATPEAAPFDTIADRLSRWTGCLAELPRWCVWVAAAMRARALGLGPLVDALTTGTLAPQAAQDTLERMYHSKVLREAARLHPSLGRFDGIAQDRLVEEFRRADRERIQLARFRVVARHHAGLPDRIAGTGATGVILAELERKRGHRPVRRLLKDAGAAVQAIKPIFMMSPLSVAQFLEPGSVEFDLLVIDEASQVEPVDAFGAFVRARQHVVVGDSKQLPPTRFFARMTSNDGSALDELDENDRPAAQAQEMESILGLCGARGLRGSMLRWHYRSRHHSLIAVSNRQFYNDELFIVPNPLANPLPGELGVVLRPVEGGVYDRGGTSTNRVEARAVCAAVLEHVRRCPHLSLGVAAFSIRQQQVIQDELELLRRENADLEDFYRAHPHEPFFVKNLESVQGDERDVILISVGYGKDADGYFSMVFGPLNSEGGERRLNVLISRAKRRCEVFTSIRSEEIDLARAPGRGVASFKAFLHFAETGRMEVAAASGREPQSPFEEAVAQAVAGLGYEVHPQVGIAGFFIDVGVVDPARPGRYMLGIECDGAAYHSARSARDRDRLRQAVLEDHGWRMYRIWSTEWFQRREDQLRKLAAELEAARRAAAEAPRHEKRSSTGTRPGNAAGAVGFEREEGESEIGLAAELSVAYREANFAVPQTPAQDLPAPAMAEVLRRIVAQEGPVHESELLARVRGLWGLGRAGSRVQESVARGLALLEQQAALERDGAFVSLRGAPVRVRNRETVGSAGLRKPEYLPPAELREAILGVVRACHGAAAPEIVQAVARQFGFKATSAALRETIQAQLDALKSKGKLREESGVLRGG